MLGALILSLSQSPAQTTAHPQRADLPAPDEIRMWGALQDSNSEWRYLKGVAKVETNEFDLSADEIDYNSDTHWAYAHGHVHLEHFVTGDKLDADHGEYNLKTQEGTFYVVSGTSPAQVTTRPGVLTTTNPFYFQARWAERIKNRYILHKGYVTDCRIPKPWWTFEAPVFDIIPADRAIARHTVFRVKRVPIFYLPYYYRPLGRNPRSSGFLTPNIGHSSLYGYIYGIGYYWAMNRSYDMTGIMQYYTQRGPALRYNFRGKPNEVTDFNFNLYGVDDRQGAPQPNGTSLKEGGLEFNLTARTQIRGFHGVLDYTYLSSYLFREAFFYSPSSTIWSQNNSIGYLQRHFNDDVYALNIVLQRTQNFNSITYQNQVPNQIIIQKLPSIEFSGRDQEIASGSLPVWFSFGSTAGMLNREEPLVETNGSPLPSQIFHTGEVGRIDLQPRVMTELDFKGFSLNPSISLGATDYTNSYAVNTTTYAPGGSCGDPTCPVTTAVLRNSNLFRKNADLALDLRFPAIERIYTPPKWLHLGEKAKHVVEAQATYEYVTGINQFQRTILFDGRDILSNTNQVTYSLTNRLYTKDKGGNVKEVVTWRLVQAYYFDPTFGNTIITGQRNVVLAVEELTPYTFLDMPRSYSPVISSLIVNPYSFLGLEYRAEYDPLTHKFLDHTLAASVRQSKFFGSVSETAVTTNPILIPQQNQLSFGGGYGASTRKGWNAAGSVVYDMLHHQRLFDFFQVSYNTDCCGFSFELRNFNLGIRQENQYFFSFSVANIGTFGSLQKQARIF